MSEPDAEFRLDDDLEEISGLTVYDVDALAAVEDERGRLYILDINDGEISSHHKFAGKDDFEGIERAGDRLFALRSDGVLFEIEGFEGKNVDSKKIHTGLHASCDAEGLAFDEAENRLLIACKEHPGKPLRHVRAVYAFDLGQMALVSEPVFVVGIDTVEEALGIPASSFRRFIAPLVDLNGFKPSGLAVHPKTGDIFILSSVLKIIVVLDRAGALVDILALDEELLEQPEGIAFLPNGDLFLSSEGVKKKPRLVRFNASHGE